MAIDSFVWYPSLGDGSLTFGDIPYVVRDFSGLGSTFVVPQTEKSPFQVGETLLNVRSDMRVFSISLRLVADSKEELSDLRHALSRSMVTNPVRQTGDVSMGLLRYMRPGRDTLELPCLARESPQFSEIDGAKWAADADLEFVAPYPYWRKTADSLSILAGLAGGLEFAIEFPIEFETANIEKEIQNSGDIPAPFRARVFGELTTFRLINLTTGAQLEVSGAIAAGDYVEVSTGFGEKYVRYVDLPSGATTDIFARLTLGSSFWLLRRGSNMIRFEADTNVSGSVNFYWRERFAGL